MCLTLSHLDTELSDDHIKTLRQILLELCDDPTKGRGVHIMKDEGGAQREGGTEGAASPPLPVASMPCACAPWARSSGRTALRS